MRDTALYVRNVLDAFDGPEETSDGWLGTCPCPLHGTDGKDSHPSVRITVGESGKVLICCRAGCETDDVLAGAGLTWHQLYPGPGEEPQEPVCNSPVQPTEEEAWFRHAVHHTLLAALPLEENHRQQLLDRGLDPLSIARGQYKTWRNLLEPDVLPQLHEAFGESLLLVPGFCPGPQSIRTSGDFSGLLVPVRDSLGRIVGLKVRREGQPRYCYWSGPISCGSPVHCPVREENQDLSILRLTEGELKAEVAFRLTGTYTLGCPGAAHWPAALPILETLFPPASTPQVLVAYDWPEVKSSWPLASVVLSLLDALQEKGYQVSVEWWDSGFKGVDDLLAAGLTTSLIPAATAREYLLSRKPKELVLVEPPSVSSSPLPAFPVSVFPAPVRQFVEEVSAALPIVVDFPAIAALTVAGTVIGTSRQIWMKNGWTEFPNLYVAVVGPPGCLKTPAIGLPMRPLREIEAELAHKYHLACESYQQDLVEWKAKKSAYELAVRQAMKSDSDLPEPPDEQPQEPCQQALVVDDFTIESVCDRLAANPRGLLDFQDELVSWVNSMNQYKGGKGTDRQFFLKAWSCQPHKVTRKNKGNKDLTLDRPFLSVLGGIQPEILPDLGDAHGREDGFFARMLFSYPEVEQAPDFSFESEISKESMSGWEQLCRKLRCFGFGEKGVPDEQGKVRFVKCPHDVLLTEKAKQAFLCWHDLHRAEVMAPEFPANLRASWSKFKAYQARFTLILHMMRLACGEKVHPFEADEETVNRASLVTHYFKQHARKAFSSLGVDKNDRNLDDFSAWLVKQGGQVKLRDLYRLRRWGIKGKDSAIRFLKQAEDRGLGSFGTDLGKNSQEMRVFSMNPDTLHSLLKNENPS